MWAETTVYGTLWQWPLAAPHCGVVSVKAALYARVSTDDGRQTVANQVRQLRELAAARDFEIFREYRDEETGVSANRASFLALLRDARWHSGSYGTDMGIFPYLFHRSPDLALTETDGTAKYRKPKAAGKKHLLANGQITRREPAG